MKLTLPAASALLCLSAALPAQAGPVLSIAPAITDFGNYENVDSALGGKALLGWHFESIPVLIEASYLHTGKHDINNSPTSRNLQFKGGDFAVGGFPYRSQKLGLDTWIKTGYYYGRTDLETTTVGLTDDSDGFMGGVGVAWKFSDWAAVRLDVTAYMEVRDFNNNGFVNDDESTLWSTTAGLMLTIPSGSREESRRPAPPVAAAEPAPAVPTAAEPTADAAAQPEPEAAPAAEPESDAVRVTPVVEPASPVVAQTTPAAPPVAAPPAAPMPPAAPVVAAAPAAPAVSHPTRASQLEPGLRVTLKRDTPLLTRPLVGAQVDGVMQKSTDAELSHRVVNANGAWWFIRSDRLAGWVPEEALLRIQ